MVTDETGTVVYSAAHDPYGGIQKTGVSTYEPALKFSGKERDAESGSITSGRGISTRALPVALGRSGHQQRGGSGKPAAMEPVRLLPQQPRDLLGS